MPKRADTLLGEHNTRSAHLELNELLLAFFFTFRLLLQCCYPLFKLALLFLQRLQLFEQLGSFFFSRCQAGLEAFQLFRLLTCRFALFQRWLSSLASDTYLLAQVFFGLLFVHQVVFQLLLGIRQVLFLLLHALALFLLLFE